MIKSKRYIVVFGCSILVIAGIVLAIKYLHDRGINYPTGVPSESDVIYFYEISPATILNDLSLGQSSVFEPTDISVGSIDTAYPPGSFPWQQSDYIMIANALNQLESNESGGWKIYGMIFERNCQNESLGFDSAEITYFKYDNQQDSYRIHQIGISPLSRIVSFMEKGGFRRPLFGWKSINLNILFVSADTALQRAEENGGKQFRASLNNACKISLVTKPTTGGNDWLVSYYANSSADNFRIHVDPYTGWHRISD